MIPTPDVTAARLMPAEWGPHEATWLAWPHEESDWPGKSDAIPWVFAEIVRAIEQSERVEILCRDETVADQAKDCLARSGVRPSGYRLHLVPTDRCWLRDSAPTAVRRPDGSIEWIDWRFNGWAKYDNYLADDRVPLAVESITGCRRVEAMRPDRDERLVLEGGAIDTDGAGTLLTTEECLLSSVQARNPGLDRQGYEKVFTRYLGIGKTIWLGQGCVGDDTHGHVDDVARFVGPATVVLAFEPDPADANHAAGTDNLRRLRCTTDAAGQRLRVVLLPMPRAIVFDDQRLPASYANFYVANRTVLVPTFNDPNDRVALNTLADLFPDRRVIGIHAADLIWGLGTLHCLTQQQPAGSAG